MIEISGVSWTYPHAEAPALRELELRIESGQFVVLCGASGSGKSTALRLITGPLPPFPPPLLLPGPQRFSPFPCPASRSLIPRKNITRKWSRRARPIEANHES